MVIEAEAVPRKSARRWRLRTWVVVSAAGAWLAFVVAHRGVSGRAWWWTIPELTPPLAFAVVPVALLAVAPLARPARGAVAVAAVLSLAVGWSMAGVNVTALWHRSAPIPPGAITVFAWNTWYWDQPVEQTGGPSRDTDRFYRYLRQQKADVYLLQEYLYFSDDWLPIRIDDTERLRREFPGFHVVVAGELVTLSRFPVVLERPLDLRPWLSKRWNDLPPTDSRMPDYYTAKTLRTDLLVGGRVVSFYNSHFTVPTVGLPFFEPDSQKGHDVRRANYRALAADVAGNPFPIVLAGDLNTSPAMGLLRALPDRLTDATRATGSVYPATWARFGMPLWRLDWLFTTEEVTVRRYRMVLADGQSDHRAQHLTMSISECREGNSCG